MEILQLRPHDERFHLFENFPAEVYPEDHHRFRLPENINMEFLKACYVLMEGNKVCSRAALYHNPNLCFQEKESWCIGNYESTNNLTSGKTLLQHVIAEAQKEGARFIIGPMNGSTWDNYRLQVESPHPDFFMEPVHPFYYHDHFKSAGFAPIARYFSSIDRELKFDYPEVLEREKELRKEGVSFRNIKLEEYEKELDRIYTFNSLAFRENFLFTPISREAFYKKNLGFKNVIMPEFTILAEDKNKELISYFFCIEDFLNTKEKCLIVKTLARNPDKKWKGLGHVIGNMIYKRAKEKGYKSIVHALVYEGGTSIQLSKNFSGENYKNYILYGKAV